VVVGSTGDDVGWVDVPRCGWLGGRARARVERCDIGSASGAPCVKRRHTCGFSSSAALGAILVTQEYTSSSPSSASPSPLTARSSCSFLLALALDAGQ
jgi:hypothetical protein